MENYEVSNKIDAIKTLFAAPRRLHIIEVQKQMRSAWYIIKKILNFFHRSSFLLMKISLSTFPAEGFVQEFRNDFQTHRPTQ